MNTRSLLIGTCLVAGLSGLGYLAWYVYGDAADQDHNRQDSPAKKKKPGKDNNDNRTRQKPPARASRPPGQQRSQPETYNAKVQKAALVVSEAVRPLADEFPLRLGSKGKRVERLQVWLMRNYGWTGKITDVFDKKTEGILKRFLKKAELDEATYNRMKMGSPVHRQPAIQ